MAWRTWIGALALVAATSSAGCLLAAAGVVEASKDGEHSSDPMGAEYRGPHGWVGWRHHYDRPVAAMNNLLGGMTQLRCGVSQEAERIRGQCYNRPPLVAMQQGNTVYRLCPPHSDIMMCRSAWEAVHNAAPHAFRDEPR
ncbi:MAG: hypothetical protein JRI68_14430 [Deltaproteobacteria bacterium]|nr:hypothetical protein [Deltaproteobacteria bacterium]